MSSLLDLDARLRAALRANARVSHALAYGSVPQGVSDAFSDLEYYAFVADPSTFDVRAFLDTVTPVHLCVVNEFGTPNVVTEDLRRVELHVEPVERLADVRSWRGVHGSVEAMLVKDADGQLRAALEALAANSPVDPASQAQLTLDRALNWLVFGANVVARGERVRALELLWWLRGALLRLARLHEHATGHFENASRQAERELSAAALDRFAALTGRVDDVDALYRSAWTWTNELASSLGLHVAEPVARALDRRFAEASSPPGALTVVGCAVPEAQRRAFERHLTPDAQPFFVPEALLSELPARLRWTRAEFRAMNWPLSFVDTFTLYRVSADLPWVALLGEDAFAALDEAVRTRLVQGQRRAGRGGVFDVTAWSDALPPEDVAALRATPDGLALLWPSVWRALSAAGRTVILRSVLAEDRLAHRGRELSAAHWAEIDERLPGVRSLAGTFADESGANCLGTVVAAFGEVDAANVWLHPEPFERWLFDGARRGHEPDALGTVLVWRDATGRVQHAAVSLGRGWAFQKDAQGWFAPRQIVRLDDLVARWFDETWTVEAWRRA